LSASKEAALAAALLLLLLVLTSCSNAPPAITPATDPALPDSVDVLIAEDFPGSAEALALLDSDDVSTSRGTSVVISLSHVVQVVNSAFGWPSAEFEHVWYNKDTPTHAHTVAVSKEMGGIWDDYFVVLAQLGWSQMPTRPTSPLLGFTDFADLGSFRLPKAGYAHKYRIPIAKVPGKEELFVVGGFGVQRVTIPAPVASSRWQDVPIAVHVEQNPLQPGDWIKPLFTTMPSGHTLGTLTVIAGDLVTGSYEFYNTAGRDHSGIATVLGADFVSPVVRGPWRIMKKSHVWTGPDGRTAPKMGHANSAHGGWLGQVPPAFARVHFPQWPADSVMFGGRRRAAGAFGGNDGPSLYAFRYDPSAPPGTDLGGVPLMHFPEHWNTWPRGGKHHNAYEVVWPYTKDGRSCIIVAATDGMGPNYYGKGPGCPCCTHDKGWHCPPYEGRWYLIDPADIVRVLNGEISPWEVQPVAEQPGPLAWAPADPACFGYHFTDMHWDAEGERLFASQAQSWPAQSSGGSRTGSSIHVWGIGGEADTTGGGGSGGVVDVDYAVPLVDMGDSTLYLGVAGGLYLNGLNDIPASHLAIRPALDMSVPLVLMSTGYSNVNHAFCDNQSGNVGPQNCASFSFIAKARGTTATLIVNAAQGGRPIDDWDEASDGTWHVAESALVAHGLTRDDVQIIYASHASKNPSGAGPAGAAVAEIAAQYAAHVRLLHVEYPNVKLCYWGTRTRSVGANISPEPYAYETAYAVKRLIDAQIVQMRDGTIDPALGDLSLAVAPWLAWATYEWAEATPRKYDGVSMPNSYLGSDGAHMNNTGRSWQADLLFDFFSAQDWW
jgi:hypothetical protein